AVITVAVEYRALDHFVVHGQHECAAGDLEEDLDALEDRYGLLRQAAIEIVDQEQKIEPNGGIVVGLGQLRPQPRDACGHPTALSPAPPGQQLSLILERVDLEVHAAGRLWSAAGQCLEMQIQFVI